MSTSTSVAVRFHHAMETTPGQFMVLGFWATEPATPVTRVRITHGDGTVYDWSAGTGDPISTGGLNHVYALEDRILDTYSIGFRLDLAGGGTLTQQARAVVDLGYAAGRLLSGTAFSDAMAMGSGGDTVNAAAGHDMVSGGDGNDMISLGTGDDWADGGAGNDTVQGGDGVNNLFGADGADLLVGGQHKDMMVGDGWGDTAFADTLNGGGGDDDLFGNGGNDLLLGGAGNDYLDGGEGNDRLFGQGGDNAFFAGAGHDSLLAEAGNDYLDGGAGNDTVNAGAGADTVTGGPGADLIRLGANDGAADRLLFSPGGGGDRVFDFVAGLDEISILGIPTVPEARFVSGVSPRAPVGVGLALLFDTATHRLWLDADGRGGVAPDLVAVLEGVSALGYGDFVWG